MKTFTHRLALATACVWAAACTLGSPEAPLPTGPSELGLSLTLSASPDIISHDGGSQSVITVVARDQFSQPVAGLPIRLEIAVGGLVVDYGHLSTKLVTTNNNGIATTVYTAPLPPSSTTSSDTIVSILATPVGNNYDNSWTRLVSIRLGRPGTIIPPGPPNGSPTAAFTFSPSSPAANQEVLFNASASSDTDGNVVSYQWNFGDGDSETTSSPIVEHSFDEPGSFTVTLIVVDNGGRLSVPVTQSVTVGVAQTPTASFVFSPTDPAPGQTINFDASESRAPESRSIVSYHWNFGDGTTQTTTSPRITKAGGYATENVFTVTLTVTDSAGRTHTLSRTITVED